MVTTNVYTACARRGSCVRACAARTCAARACAARACVRGACVRGACVCGACVRGACVRGRGACMALEWRWHGDDTVLALARRRQGTGTTCARRVSERARARAARECTRAAPGCTPARACARGGCARGRCVKTTQTSS